MNPAKATQKGKTRKRQAAAKEPRPSEGAGRREQLLDAALRVIARDGLRALTHRAVEAEAGAPHGSTTYHFGSRNDLLAATIEHMRVRDLEIAQNIAHGLTLLLADRSQPVDFKLIADAIVAWVDAEPENQLARFELQIAGARDPKLKSLMTACAGSFWRMCEPIVVAAGSKNPQHDARLVQSALDGWVLDRLTHDDPDDRTLAEGIARLLGSFADA